MKPKKGFPGRLLPSREQNYNPIYPREDPPPENVLLAFWREYRLPIIVFAAALTFMLIGLLSYGQERALTAGDVVPDVTLSPILNYRVRSVRVPDFRGKLLILDFWDTWCSSCVRGLRRLDTLQRMFGDRVMILPVTDQKAALVSSFLRANSYLSGATITTLTDDRVLGRLFPHNQLPHEVWISADGKVLGTTAGEYVNAANIRAVLAGRPPEWAVKRDAAALDTTSDTMVPELLRRAGDTAALFAECLTGYEPGLPLKAGVVYHSVVTTYYYINHPPLHLYALALGSPLPFDPKRRILETADTSKFVYARSSGYADEWQRAHALSFTATVPDHVTKEAVMEDLKAKLDAWCGMTGRIERRMMPCLALCDLNEPPSPLYSGYPVKEVRQTSGGASLHAITARDLAWLLDHRSGLPPVFDESRQKMPFDLELGAWPRTIADWNKALHPLGLALRATTRPLDMFVLGRTQPARGETKETTIKP